MDLLEKLRAVEQFEMAEAERIREVERKKRELEEAATKAQEAKTALLSAQIALYKVMFPGEFEPRIFSMWRKQIPATLDEIRSNPGKNAEPPKTSIGSTEPVANRQAKRNHTMGIPSPSGKSINGNTVYHYSSYNDILLWLDAEAWIADNEAINAIMLAFDNFLFLTFPNANTNIIRLAAQGFFHYGRSPDAVSTIIVDALLELFNEMCLIPGDPIPRSNRRKPCPFFKSWHFRRLSESAKYRMPNVALLHK